LELRHLRYFVATAEERSFVQAARRLRVAQPAISKQVRDLENELGVALLERLPRGVRLTSAGEGFLEQARITLEAAERAIASVRGAGGTQDLKFAHGEMAVYNRLIEGLLAAFRERSKESPAGNVPIASGETWALASEAVAAPYRTTPTAIVYRPFVEPPIPCWIGLVWLQPASPAVSQLVEVAQQLQLTVD